MKASFPPIFKPSLLLLFLLAGLFAKATTYYFAASGDDLRSAAIAQNPATPWRSLAKLNAIFNTLRPGDSVLFKRGDVFEGSIVAAASGSATMPIVFSAYGNGARPIVSGFVNIVGWTSAGNNIWEADASRAGSMMNVVLVNGAFQPIGRYPNASAAKGGYLTIDSYNANTAITSAELAGSRNWVGAEAVIRKNRWILDRNPIIGQSGNTLTYSSGSGYHATTGYGFFIQNHPGTLDQAGEWYCVNRRLGVFFPGGSAPTSVQGSVVPVLVTVSGHSNLVFSGISFNGANDKAFDIGNASNVSITDCAVLFSGVTAFNVTNGNGLRIENSLVDLTNNLALSINGSNMVVRRNQIKRTGSIAGMGKSGDGTYTAILVSGDNNLVEGNTIEQTGYVPISFNGFAATIKNNYIDQFTLVKDDGGGIYTWNNSANAPNYIGQKVTGNIVMNGRSASNGTREGDKKFAHGIYLDDNVANVEVSGNTVANCEGYGLYIHNARQNRIIQNTCYNNTVQIAMVRDDIAPNSPINNTEVRGNIFFSLHPLQTVAEYKSNADDVAGFGTFEQNYYCRPFDDNGVIGVLKRVSGTYSYQLTDVAGWQAMYGKDAGSKGTPKTFLPYVVSAFNGANKFANGSFTANAGGLYAYAPANNCQTSWVGNGLDGGTLSVGFNSSTNYSKGTVIIGIGAIAAGKKYLLRFSVRAGNEHKMLDVYLRKSGSPYNDVSERKLAKLTGDRKEVAILFTAAESTADGSIGIDVPEQRSAVYFDNIDLREVSATEVNPADSIRFVYNATPAQATQGLNGKYMDAKSAVFDGSISLAPYSAAVLMAAGSGPATLPPTVPNPTPQPAACAGTGSILRERWLNVAGNDVALIPLQLRPDGSDGLNAFEIAPDAADNYGSRVRGYLCPPQTGAYTFWIAGDDAVELWLSDSENPSVKKRIAYSLSWTGLREWGKSSSQKSVPVNLVAGRKYYVEALHKEGGGGDHLSVAWQLPDGKMEAPIAGNRLLPFQPAALTAQSISFVPPPDVQLGSTAINLVAAASSGLPVRFTIVSGPGLIDGNRLTPTAAGSVIIKASQPGNSQYSAAPDVQQVLKVVGGQECPGSGSISREQWSNVDGNNIYQIPLTIAPSLSNQLGALEMGQNAGNRFGARIRGYICPQQTGNYTFWISGDDATELWLSSNEAPTGKRKIAYSVQWTNFRDWNRFATQKSAPVYLEAFRKYYIEVLHKEGGGNDHVSVAWQLPGGTIEAPIPGKRLSPFTAGSNAAMRASQRSELAALEIKTDIDAGITAFPNPFRANTTLQAVVAETGTAVINIQDASGRVVKRLFSGRLEKGVPRRFDLQSAGLAPGVYVVSLVAGTQHSVCRLVMVQ